MIEFDFKNHTHLSKETDQIEVIILCQLRIITKFHIQINITI